MGRAVHWNFNLVCAIDIETSGKDPAKHDILQIAILPLKGDLTPDTSIIPFEMLLQPQKKRCDVQSDAMRTNKLDWQHQYDTCMDPWKVAELLEEWWLKLKLPFRKSIIPLAHNWTFEYKFLHEWLGPQAMDDYFFQYRDSMALANAINDIADMRNEPWPFPKTSLEYLCSQLKVQNIKPHDALADAMACAECYRKLVTQYRLV